MNTLFTTYRYPTSLFKEFGDIFDDLTPQPKGFSPTITYSETPTEYIITGEFPGMETKDIVLELKENVLSVSGEKPPPVNQPDHKIHSNERKHGKFQRHFHFSQEINSTGVIAEMKNGVLTVTVPKSTKSKRSARRLEITQG